MIILMLAMTAATRVYHHGVPSKPETLHVVSINLTDEGITTLELKDASGQKLEPVRIPTTVCRKDHLGRLLPGNDVTMTVAEGSEPAGTKTRLVEAEQFREWCQ